MDFNPMLERIRALAARKPAAPAPIIERKFAVTYNKNRAHYRNLHDPARKRSPEELAKMAAAELKRERRAEKKVK